VLKSVPPRPLPRNFKAELPIIATLIVLFGLLVVKNAWLSDDAYITFRTVDNFLAGHGLVYNVGERVQSYTHPLWLMLLIPLKGIFGELYYSPIFLSILLSLAAVLLLIQQATNRWLAVMVVIALATSKAFVDFTTSGLENPLSYFLLAILIAYAPKAAENRKNLAIACFIASLAALSRLDTLLISLPLLGYSLWKVGGWRSLWAVCIGMGPLIIWTLFSVLYYGAPVANTVYAKLNTGISESVMLAQGASYFADSLRRDQATLVTILAGVVLGITSKRRISICLSIGVVLYLLYIVYVGGDFMSGRFLTLPLLVAVVLLTWRAARWSPKRIMISCSALLLLSLPSAEANMVSGRNYGDVPLVPTEQFGPLPLSLIGRDGICDERAFYYPATGLLRPNSRSFPSHQWARWGEEARLKGAQVTLAYAIGFFGYYAGPEVHIIDGFALNDFLLARLPVPHHQVPRIGHFARELPQGYYESVSGGMTVVTDTAMARFYDDVKLVTQRPLFSEGRLAAIWKMNTGGYNHLIESYEAKNN
jgi:arabinofuranosyltransferase